MNILCFSEQKLIFHFVQLHTATNKIKAIKIMKIVWKFIAFWLPFLYKTESYLNLK